MYLDMNLHQIKTVQNLGPNVTINYDIYWGKPEFISDLSPEFHIGQLYKGVRPLWLFTITNLQIWILTT